MDGAATEAGESKRRIRVLFVGGSLGGGGAERQLLDLYQKLDQSRFDPRLWVMFREGELLDEVAADTLVEFGERPRLRQRIWARLTGPVLARVHQLRATIDRGQPDVIVGWSLKCSYLAAVAIGSRAIPWLAYSAVEPRFEITDAFPRDPCGRGRARWTYHRATLVMANSTAARTLFQQTYQLPETRLAASLHSRDLQRVRRLAQQSEPVWPGPGPRLIAIGRLAWQKRFDVLLEALAVPALRERPWQLLILGDGPERATLVERAARLGLRERLHFPGFVANPYPWLRTADLFVLSSQIEGLPNVLIEALVCGTRVVATDCPTGPREILEDGRWGPLVPVGDPQALAEAIRSQLEAPMIEGQADLARQAMFARYDDAVVRPRFEAILEQLVAQAAATPSSRDRAGTGLNGATDRGGR